MIRVGGCGNEWLQVFAALSRLSWSQVMRRTFKLDLLECPCGGRREVIALIPSGEIATKILAHLRLAVTAESFLPIRAPPWPTILAGPPRTTRSTFRSLTKTPRRRAQARTRAGMWTGES